MSANLFTKWAKKIRRLPPLKLLLWGYGIYIFVPWLFLCLPISWKAESISLLDNLFIATSAVSTTGLVTVNTPDAYNFLGQFVIFCAFQIGGLGYMTLGSFILIASKNNLPYFHRKIGSSVFALPEGFNLKLFIKHTVFFTIIIEVLGAIGLYICFSQAGVENSLWAATFHSVSAFCTAGFSVFPNSLEDYSGNLPVNLIVSVLSIFGSIGFLVVSDIWQSLTGKKQGTTFTTKIILWITAWFLLTGFVLMLILDQSLAELPLFERVLTAWFQAMTALTTVGFNTYPIGGLSTVTVLLVIILMIVGASPSGTGGGLKSTSVSAAIAVMWNTLRGQSTIAFLGRKIPEHRLFTAFSALVFYLLTFLIGSMLLLAVQPQGFEDLVFEVASALGTVGLSRGITGDLTSVGKWIVIVLMFMGRVGALSFGIALFNSKSSQREDRVVMAEEDLAI